MNGYFLGRGESYKSILLPRKINTAMPVRIVEFQWKGLIKRGSHNNTRNNTWSRNCKDKRRGEPSSQRKAPEPSAVRNRPDRTPMFRVRVARTTTAITKGGNSGKVELSFGHGLESTDRKMVAEHPSGDDQQVTLILSLRVRRGPAGICRFQRAKKILLSMEATPAAPHRQQSQRSRQNVVILASGISSWWNRS